MPGKPVSIRDATDDDLAAIQAIYAHHVNHGLASFEEIPPDVDEIARRRDVAHEHNLPYLVAVMDGAVRGFA